jgi:hypothetical protein
VQWVAQNVTTLLFWSGPALTTYRPTQCHEVLPLSVASHRTGQFAKNHHRFFANFAKSSGFNRIRLYDPEMSEFIHPASVPKIGGALL